jgi:hypothetical protein
MRRRRAALSRNEGPLPSSLTPAWGEPPQAAALAAPGRVAAVAMLLYALAPSLAAEQAASAVGGIYTCVDAQGRRLTSDRPIPDCLSREQRVLNKDGSLRAVAQPPLTADERAEREAAERKAAVERAAQADAVRRDRNLMMRFPGEGAHRKAREKALDTVRAAIKATETRLADLSAERKPLDEEAEFYKGRQMPARLRSQIDANEAAFEAQKALAQNQAVELVRINNLYDAELARLKRLWGGAQPGSLGPTAAAELSRASSSAAR